MVDDIGSMAETGSYWVNDPEIADVLDLDSGQIIPHDQAIGTDYEKVIQLRSGLRTALQRDRPRLACSICSQPVYLVSGRAVRRFFFRHTLEDGRCPARTRGLLSQDEIDARRYNGVKESRAHKQLKAWVAESLLADPMFSGVDVERRWTGAVTGEWRQPDVQAIYRGTRVAFEVQLSTTYLNVIVGRREFYLREGGLLFWVFGNFDLGTRRLIHDDVFFNNNRNAFVVSHATRNASIARRAFSLECLWPSISLDGKLAANREQVAFEQLTLDMPTQRAYFYDFDGHRQAHIDRVRAEEMARRAPLREKFEAWCVERITNGTEDYRTWGQLRRECEIEGLRLPPWTNKLPWSLLQALYSAKFGGPFGWNLETLTKCAHYVVTRRPAYLRYFYSALQAYHREEQIRSEDASGKWQEKVDKFVPLLRSGLSEYAADLEHEDLVRLLFPEIFPLRPEPA